MMRRLAMFFGLFLLASFVAGPVGAGAETNGEPTAGDIAGDAVAEPGQSVEPLAEPASLPGQLRARHSGRCVEVPGSSMANDTVLVQADCTGGNNQQVTAVEVDGARVELRFTHSGKCIQVRDASTVEGARLVQGECDLAPHTLWSVANNRFGKRLTVLSTGMCMDVDGQELAPGTELIQWPCGNNQSNQTFTGLPFGTALGGVVTEGGVPPRIVGMDLFSSNVAGERLAFLAKASTDSDGRYTFELDDPGCYVVTFIAPTGRQFTNGLAWLDVPACVEDGQRLDTVNAELAVPGELAGIGDNVSYSDGEAAGGVSVDLFTATPDGVRGGYVRSTMTSDAGSYSFAVDAGCYVVTFIAPTGQTFVNGSEWSNVGLCLAGGETNDDIDAVLQAGASQPTLNGTVFRSDGSGQPGAVVDLFTANADGSRGAWLTDLTTNAGGEFTVEVQPGCYVLTFIAPAGETFTNGSQWFNQSVCVAAGESASNLDAVLS